MNDYAGARKYVRDLLVARAPSRATSRHRWRLTMNIVRRAAASTLAGLAGALLSACADSVGIADDTYDLEFDFTSGQQEWVAGFVDYVSARRRSVL